MIAYIIVFFVIACMVRASMPKAIRETHSSEQDRRGKTGR